MSGNVEQWVFAVNVYRKSILGFRDQLRNDMDMMFQKPKLCTKYEINACSERATYPLPLPDCADYAQPHARGWGENSMK